VSVCNLSPNVSCFISTTTFPHKAVVYETWSCACSHIKRLVCAHLLTWSVVLRGQSAFFLVVVYARRPSRGAAPRNAVAGNNDAVVNGFSRTGRRLAGTEAGRRRSSMILLVWNRSRSTRDRRDATGGRGLSVRQKDVRRSREVVAGETRWSRGRALRPLPSPPFLPRVMDRGR